MPQRGMGGAADVREADVIAFFQQGSDLRRQNQGLYAAGGGPEADDALGGLDGELSLGMSGQTQSDGVVLHVLCNRHPAGN